MSGIQFFDEQPEIVTSRLLLRPLREADAEAMFAYASLEEATKYVLFHTHRSVEDSAEFIRVATSQAGTGFGLVWAIELLEGHRMIGTIGIHNVELDVGSVEAGYIIHPDHWGKGYTAEALEGVIAAVFGQSDINRIAAMHVAEHVPSGRVMQKAGMTYEGTLRQFKLLKGAPRDMSMYSIIRSDHEAARRR
ncbi:MAG: GNAT family N-acetyltransferase [Bacteroidetes bacterium]|nr:GNAT family N-acetyltransferase [Bacteroidota bacterium]